MRTGSQHFGVYKHKLIGRDGQIITRYLIVLKNPDKTLRFTDFHKYVRSSINRIRRVDSNDYTRFMFVCKFLNYAFFERGIEKLTDLTIQIAEDFLNAYGMCELDEDDDNTIRSGDTVKRCASYLMDLYIELIKNSVITEKEKDLYDIREVRGKTGMIIERKFPKFQATYIDRPRAALLRDMPDAAFRMIYANVREHHLDMLAVVSLCAFAGLRPSEACNVRRVDSSLGAGIIFGKYNGMVESIEIDLTMEKNLRSDMVSVGRIKKERRQIVPEIFINPFVEAYNAYMTYMNGKYYEKEYGPLSVNRSGKALTYASFRQKFQKMINEEMIPQFLHSDDQRIVLFGRMLQEHQISVHIFRHWYTVQLVLSGVSDPGELMAYRGDKNPESALEYLKNKGDIARQYRDVNNKVFDYFKWEAERRIFNDRSSGDH